MRKMLILLPIVTGILGITVLMLFPVWNVSYRNSAGLDVFELKDGTVRQIHLDKDGVTSRQTACKRSLVFGGVPRVGWEIERTRDLTPEEFRRCQIIEFRKSNGEITKVARAALRTG